MSTNVNILLQQISNNPTSPPPAEILSNAMTDILTGVASPPQSAALLTALHFTKLDQSADVITNFAKTMRNHALVVRREDLGYNIPKDQLLIDVVGTGGDGWDTFNASTSAGIIAAGAGCLVCKHGNKAATSTTGSADLLTSLGCQLIPLVPSTLSTILLHTTFAFLLAPTYHPGLRHVASVRKEIGIRTIFNILGPLSNPAPIDACLVGIAQIELGPIFAESLRLMGRSRAIVVCGAEGLDEVSPAGPTLCWRVHPSCREIEHFIISPADFGLEEHPLSQVASRKPHENAETLMKLLYGDLNDGDPILDFVLLNAAVLLVVAEKARDWRDGIRLARETLKSGRARRALEGFREGSQTVAAQLADLQGNVGDSIMSQDM